MANSRYPRSGSTIYLPGASLMSFTHLAVEVGVFVIGGFMLKPGLDPNEPGNIYLIIQVNADHPKQEPVLVDVQRHFGHQVVRVHGDVPEVDEIGRASCRERGYVWGVERCGK